MLIRGIGRVHFPAGQEHLVNHVNDSIVGGDVIGDDICVVNRQSPFPNGKGNAFFGKCFGFPGLDRIGKKGMRALCS